MKTEIPAPVAAAIIAVLVIVMVVAGYFYFTRKEIYKPSPAPSGRVQQLRPVVPGQGGTQGALMQGSPAGQGGTPAQGF